MPHSLFANLAQRFEPPSPVARRHFLKLALAASTGVLLSGTDAFAKKPRTKRHARKIIIVGGGFSGLSCAYELMSAGCHVTVLEARDRVGGRVVTFRDLVDGKTVEGGGEYIGTNHPTWLAYARKFHLELFPGVDDENADQPVILEGHRLDTKQAKALFDEMKVANQHMTADAVKVNADEPWKTPGAVELDRLNTARWLRNVPVSRWGKLAWGSQLAGNNGAPLGRQSYLGNLAQVKGGGLDKYWTDSEIYRCRGGNQSLAIHFARALGEHLRLEMPVTGIATRCEGVVVRCANGQTFEGDDVVVTVPPSIWRQIKFDPALPHALRPQMGVVVKHLSVLTDRFWKKEHLGPNAASDGMVSMTWDATEAQPGPGAVLTAFSGGSAAEQCRRRWSSQQEEAYRKELEKFYPGYRTKWQESRFMDWPADPWTAAGYSFPAPGEVTTVGPLLRDGGENLYFAGEHTCYAFVGYMEGALHSGVASAHRVLAEKKSPASATRS